MEREKFSMEIMQLLEKVRILLMSCVCVVLTRIIPRTDKIVVFGAWTGKLYADNPKYFFEYMAKLHPQGMRLVWIGDKSLADEIPRTPWTEFTEKDSLKSLKWLLRAKYLICSHEHRPDFSSYNVYHGAKIIFLNHGPSGIKNWGTDTLDYHDFYIPKSRIKKIWYKIIGQNVKYDFFAVSSLKGAQTELTALGYLGATKETQFPVGTPRNDYLIQNKENQGEIEKQKKRYAQLLGFDVSKKVILYLPTFRRKTLDQFSFSNLDGEAAVKLEEVLRRHNAVILEKSHFVDAIRGCLADAMTENVIGVAVPVDLQEMYLFTDIQITDYSSSCFDYCLTDKPSIQFLYDLEEYRNTDTGLYFEPEEFSIGKITRTAMETINEIDALLSGTDLYQEQRHYVRNHFMEYERGDSCEKIYELLWGGQASSAFEI